MMETDSPTAGEGSCEVDLHEDGYSCGNVDTAEVLCVAPAIGSVTQVGRWRT